MDRRWRDIHEGEQKRESDSAADHPCPAIAALSPGGSCLDMDYSDDNVDNAIICSDTNGKQVHPVRHTTSERRSSVDWIIIIIIDCMQSLML